MDYNYNNQYTSNTGYGGGGMGNGGGFTNDSSQQSGGGGKPNYSQDTLRPVTAKQVLDATLAHPDANFRISNSEVTQITFVGQIRGMVEQATNIMYQIDDGTGTVEVKQWTGDGPGQVGDEAKAKSALAENMYVRVFGRIKEFQNRRHVGAHLLRPITDFNEINYHLLEATATHLYFTRGPPPTAGSRNTAGFGADSNAMDTSGGAGGSAMSSLSPVARKFLMTLKNEPQSNEGMHVQHLSAKMGVGISEVYKAAEELVSQGMIFTTVDDDTYAVLEM